MNVERLLKKLDAMPGTNVDLKNAIRKKLIAQRQSPLAQVFGKWPGDETDEEINAMLNEKNILCNCWTCMPDQNTMVLCRKCGNKRCPHASDCKLACTNSNEPGQEGSVYGYPVQTTLPFAKGSDTSKAAAKSMVEPARKARQRVFDFIKSKGAAGATCDYAEASLGMSHQTCSARVNELRNAGRIADSGLRKRTRSGRKAVVYTVSR